MCPVACFDGGRRGEGLRPNGVFSGEGGLENNLKTRTSEMPSPEHVVSYLSAVL